MTRAAWFWIFFVLWLLFSVLIFSNTLTQNEWPRLTNYGSKLLEALLIFMLGLQCYGSIVKPSPAPQ